MASIAFVGVAGLLAVGGRERSSPDPAPPSTTTTAIERESPQLAWVVAGEPGYYSSGSVRALDRDRTVIRLTRIAEGDEGGGSLMKVELDISDRVGETLRLSADLKVEGSGDAGLWMRISAQRLENRGVAEPLADRATPQEEAVVAGEWQRRSIELVVPAGATTLTYGIYLRGAGSVYVDEVEEP